MVNHVEEASETVCLNDKRNHRGLLKSNEVCRGLHRWVGPRFEEWSRLFGDSVGVVLTVLPAAMAEKLLSSSKPKEWEGGSAYGGRFTPNRRRVLVCGGVLLTNFLSFSKDVTQLTVCQLLMTSVTVISSQKQNSNGWSCCYTFCVTLAGVG